MDPKEKKELPWQFPYLPLISTPVVIDPSDFKPKQGIITKYGKKLLADGEKYYHAAHTTATKHFDCSEQEAKHKAGVAKIVSRYPWLKKQ